MRYQYSMSIGHTYMRDGNFPPPVVPHIPPCFNHYLESEKTNAPPSHGTSADLTQTTPSLATPAPDGIHGPSTANSTVTPVPLAATAPEPSLQPAEGGQSEGSEDLSIQGDGMVEPGIDEEEGLAGDHWDDMEDRELIHYDDMYGDI